MEFQEFLERTKAVSKNTTWSCETSLGVTNRSDLEKERKKDGDQKEKQRQQENKKRKEEKKKKKDDDVQIFSYNRFIIVIKIETVISNCKYFILF